MKTSRADSLAKARADSVARKAAADSAARKAKADSIGRKAVADSGKGRVDSLAVQGKDTVKSKGDTLRAAGDTLGRGRRPGDSTATKREVIWAPPDSVMSALLARRGYSVTHYESKLVEFRTKEHIIYLRGKPSQVERDSATLVGDTIRFNDSTKVIVATGDTLLLRDPAQGQDDIQALGLLQYDVDARRGLVRDITTTVESGQRWVVHGAVAAFKGDTTGVESRAAFYARNGWLTSCEETEPHYHFQARELKLVSKNIMVARPAILYIADIPVAWLPFVFQDMRSGRRSGIIPPRFGFSDLVRNSTSYRRTVEDLGYYFALSDYLDFQTSFDWRSDAGAGATDPGWVRGKALLQYHWLDRFVEGNVGFSYHALRNGETNKEISVMHRQDFSQRTHLTADLRYMTNTTVQRNTSFNPYQALGTISSRLNFTTGRGPFSLSLGGSQTQYPGRDELVQDFPTIGITSKPIKVGEWLTWTPSLQSSSNRRLHIDQVGDFGYRVFTRPDGTLDSTKVNRDSYNSRISFDTPIQIFGFNWRNSFNLQDRINDFPERRTIYLSPTDTSNKVLRVYKRTFVTDFNWETSFALPTFFQGKWNIGPSVQFTKIDGRSGLFVRSERTGGKWVGQGLRPAAGLSMSPTFYAFIPGFGPLARIRHSIQTSISYAYTPASKVSDEFLSANGDTRVGYLGDKTRNTVSLSLNTVFEAKLKGAENDSIATAGLSGPDNSKKIKLLSLNFTSLSWDFERARLTHKTGLSERTFGYSIRSDLLPGIDFGSDYSLFQGDPISDTAVFKPYRESIRGTLSLGASSGLVKAIARLLGFRMDTVQRRDTLGTQESTSGRTSSLNTGRYRAGAPIAGSINGASNFQIPSGQGWQMSLQYTANRQRPPVGSGVLDIDPTTKCNQFKNIDPFTYQLCVNQYTTQASSNSTQFENTTRGGTFFRVPPQQSMSGSMSFHITDKWAAQWSTTYDFIANDFASQVVSLQRQLHDWDAIFAFTKAPNGNFAFNFYIALKAEPDLKLNYDRRDYPRGYSGARLTQ